MSLARCSLVVTFAFASIAFGLASPVVAATDSQVSSRAPLAARLAALAALPLPDIAPHAQVWMESLRPAEFNTARQLVLTAPASVANDIITRAALERWGQIDGPSAHAFAASLTHDRKIDFETAALAGWARVQPQQAWDRLMAISNRSADRRYDEEAVMVRIADGNLSLALDLYQDLMADRSCLFCNASLICLSALRQSQLALVEAALAQFPRGPTRNGLRDAYWNTLGQFAREEGLQKLKAVRDPDDLVAARVQLAAGWARRDFAASFEFIRTHFDADAFERAVLPVIQAWARGAVAEDVADVIARLPESLSDRSLLGIVPVLARVNPAATLDWIIARPPSAIRKECLLRGMWAWAKIDGESARTYVRAQADIDVRGYLLRSYLLAAVGNSTLSLADFADLDNRFALQWRVNLLSDLSLRLADPAENQSATFDLAAYRRWVESQAEFTDAQKAKIMEPLAPKKKPAAQP